MDDTPKPIKIKISGKLSYEDDITINQAAQIIAFVDSSSSTDFTGAPGPVPRLAPASIARPGLVATTPREALDTAKASTNPERIVAFAGMIHAEGKDTFTLEDIKPLFRRAREATPKNLSRDFDVVVRAGWADQAEEKGEYYLTTKGLETLDAGFNKDRPARKGANAGSARSKVATARRPRKPAEVPEVFRDVDPIPTSISGVPDFRKLKGDKDRFLWVMLLAKTLGKDGLSNQDVVWVTDHLGAGVPTNNVNRTFTRARDNGHVNKSTQTNKIRITDDGETYLKGLLEAES
jgi:hypothetical protein